MGLISQLAVGESVHQVGTGSNLEGSVTTILTNIIAVLGFVCVVVMIIGGVNYMTSAGDANKVEKGKKTILYGLIGLIISALAFVIVNFVVGNILKQTPSCPSGQTYNSTSQKCEKIK